jgi:hypothetical protein
MRLAARIGRATGGAGVLALGALALHELRYLLAFGADAGAELERQGHSYLETLAPLITALAVAGIVTSVVIPAALQRVPSLRGRDCTTERAAAYAAALLAVYLAQELTEGILASGHAAGLDGALGAGGWVAMPLAMALGAAAAIARSWLFRAEERLACAFHQLGLPRAPREIGAPATAPIRRALSSMALRFGLARRPPPLASRA